MWQMWQHLSFTTIVACSLFYTSTKMICMWVNPKLWFYYFLAKVVLRSMVEWKIKQITEEERSLDMKYLHFLRSWIAARPLALTLSSLSCSSLLPWIRLAAHVIFTSVGLHQHTCTCQYAPSWVYGSSQVSTHAQCRHYTPEADKWATH